MYLSSRRHNYDILPRIKNFAKNFKIFSLKIHKFAENNEILVKFHFTLKCTVVTETLLQLSALIF
jgi:hypothetical protein